MGFFLIVFQKCFSLQISTSSLDEIFYLCIYVLIISRKSRAVPQLVRDTNATCRGQECLSSSLFSKKEKCFKKKICDFFACCKILTLGINLFEADG